MKNLIIISFLFLFCGCSATYRQQRDIKKLDGLALQQPNEFARLSNILNPCFSGKAKSDTVIKKGKPDTVQLAGSTIITRVKDTVVKTITLPSRQVTIPTFITIHDTISDGRALNYLNTQLKTKSDSTIIVKTQLSQVSKSKTTWMWIAIGLISLISIFIIAKVVIFFYGGGWANTIKKVI